jgi:hypothetical protein
VTTQRIVRENPSEKLAYYLRLSAALIRALANGYTDFSHPVCTAFALLLPPEEFASNLKVRTAPDENLPDYAIVTKCDVLNLPAFSHAYPPISLATT